MATRNYPRIWAFWLASSLIAAVGLVYALANGDDKRLFMPGPLSHGHHQIDLACDACHADPFGEAAVMEDTCFGCHGDQRKKPLDSHPKTKFKDPRNADRLEKIDVLSCVTCHVEHQPDIIQGAGYTQPVDFCLHCHADIGEERPTHAGLGFDTCNSAGCHNYHNNRALYTDFLLRHEDAPNLLPKPRVPARDFGGMLEQLTDYPHARYPQRVLTSTDADVPAVHRGSAGERNWLETAHAQAGVNCSACHQPGNDEKAPIAWIEKPDHTACAGCHDAEVDGFTRGLHGMRLNPTLPKPLAPMTPAQARLPMQPAAGHVELGCVSCHAAHRFDTGHAAVDACLTCHADQHSLAYEGSPHHALWQREQDGELPAGSGVSCATCHMPRVDYEPNDWTSRILVQHNQSATLHMVMDSDRTVYTRKIVNRLAGKDKVITASEHFDDEQALVLPAQMFRFGAEMVAERAEENPDVNFSYSLQSIWPVNKQNAPRTDAEKEGLQYVADNKGENFYAVEELGGTKYFTAVYADTAVAPVCVSCHNDHKDSPRRDFKMGDVMGGVIIRIPIEG